MRSIRSALWFPCFRAGVRSPSLGAVRHCFRHRRYLGDPEPGAFIEPHGSHAAHSVPLYLYIGLRKDNEQALMFWWNASRCRQRGVGGKRKNPSVWQAHKAAMAEYRRLKPFLRQGTFYGIDELTHVHQHPSEEAAVVNCFNLENRPARRWFGFDLARHGLPPEATFEVRSGEARRSGGGYLIEVEVAAYGHTLVEVRKAA